MEPLIKRTVLRSLGLSLISSAVIYGVALAFLTTHEEVDLTPRSAFPIAAWAFPVVFLLSLLFFAVKDAGSRRH